MKSLIAAWILLLALAGALRFHDLGSRPLHADEATGARITARAQEGGYRFDPTHYHGPTLHRLGQFAGSLAGQHRWAEMEILPLRTITAIAGLLIVAAPLLGVRRFGHGPMLLAALLLATSPLLVYYSRMYIHESLLAVFGVLLLAQLALGKHLWLVGLWLGLMFATKETFVISLAAWSLAAALCWLFLGKGRPSLSALWKSHRRDLLLGIAVFVFSSLLFYTDGFLHWRGAADAIRTYFIYETSDAHHKPPFWYLQSLALPEKIRAHWWWTGAPLLLALLGARRLIRPHAPVGSTTPSPGRSPLLFLSLAAAFHLIFYSAIGYKTPWLMLLPLAHLCLLGGFAIPGNRRRFARPAFMAVLTAMISWQLVQTCRASFEFPTDSRNPFAYVPTSPDINELEPWLQQLEDAQPELPLEPIAVVGADYWPLPWYLRHYEKVGYYAEPPDSLERLPLILATSDLTDSLIATHIPIPRGLRENFPLTAWIRQDLWQDFIKTAAPSP